MEKGPIQKIAHFQNKNRKRKENKMTLSVSRRALMKGAGAGFAAALFQPAVRAADSQESQTDWSGWTICDSCNHMPMCGIHFKAH